MAITAKSLRDVPEWGPLVLIAVGLGCWSAASVAMSRADSIPRSPGGEPSVTADPGPVVVGSVHASAAREDSPPSGVTDARGAASSCPPAREGGDERGSDPAPPVTTSDDRAAAPCPAPVELLFLPASAELDGPWSSSLTSIVEASERWPDASIVVEGHASAPGRSWANLRLSHTRARSVEAMLAEAGVEPERLVVHAYGEYRPKAPGTPGEDRRVVVRLDVAGCERNG